MTAAQAMIDAALTIRVWQRERLTPTMIGRQIRCDPGPQRPVSWDAIETAIVADLLMRAAASERLAA